MIQLGRAPNRIESAQQYKRVSTDEAFASKVSAELDGIPVYIISKDALIRNKRAIGRRRDLADLEVLEC